MSFALFFREYHLTQKARIPSAKKKKKENARISQLRLNFTMLVSDKNVPYLELIRNGKGL